MGTRDTSQHSCKYVHFAVKCAQVDTQWERGGALVWLTCRTRNTLTEGVRAVRVPSTELYRDRRVDVSTPPSSARQHRSRLATARSS